MSDKSCRIFPEMAWFSLFCFAILTSHCFLPVIASPADETEALFEFKSLLKDPANVLEAWKPGPGAPCGFNGITCDTITGNVLEISLDNMSLAGHISPSISKLRSLTMLSLPSNFITGKLPDVLANCSNLRVLNLTGNQMVGPVPDLSMLQDLQILDISANYFTGELPRWVGRLTGLVSLVIGDNDFDEGGIPTGLGNLKNVTWLHMGQSHLVGEIPEDVSEMISLETLDFSVNRISGNFPKWISKLPNLKKIELYGNNLSGEIPLELAGVAALEEIDISANKLYGILPPALGNLQNLSVFQCYDNDFTGQLPPGFGNLRHLTALSIYKNRFSGDFPANLGRFSPLDSIDISENQFSGEFPRFLCESGKLLFLLAIENNFSGSFPDSYSNCKSLLRLRVTLNRFSGDIPDGVWALPYAKMIDFGDNEFTGGISSSIRNSTSLAQLVLRNNQFSGELPSEIFQLKNLERIYLSNNRFSGRIPPEVGNLGQLWSLHVEMNSLSGSIPPELSGCSKLVDLNLAFNSLTGGIPSSISRMSSLNSFNVSGNQLMGLIPESLRKLKLSSLDVSKNKLSGEIPSDLFTMGGEKAFVGNEGLCIDPGSNAMVNDSKIPICTLEQSRKNHGQLDNLVVFGIIVSVLFAATAIMLFMSYQSCNHRAGALRDQENGDFNWEEKKTLDSIQWKLASFHHMEIDAEEICNLEEKNLIGTGGTGNVYRLDLKKKCHNNLTVAVKQMRTEDGVKLVLKEMDTLGKIRHRNILKLYACLIKEGSSYLVFEYMARGNLFQALHRQVKGKLPELDWYRRYRVAVGAARGIAYLHHDCYPPIIHRDVKSTNILLDEDYEPKIADFGVAKVVGTGSEGAENFSCFAGTHGYIAPELAYSLKVSDKTDVYSFGIVLLELVTGKRPVEDEFGEGKDIVYWVVTHLKDHESLLRILDREVVCDSNRDDMIKVLKVGVLCTSKLPSLRPTMRDVVRMLVDAEPYAIETEENDPEKN